MTEIPQCTPMRPAETNTPPASVMPSGGVMLIDDIRSHDGFLTFAKRHPEFKTILVSTLDGIGAIGIAVSG